MISNTTIVVGASRDIGLGLAKFLAQSPQDRVIATMRKPVVLSEPNIQVIQLDQTNAVSVEKAAEAIKEADNLIVNAAMGEDERLTEISTKRIIFISSTTPSLTKQVDSEWGLRGPDATSKAAGNMLAVQFHNELRDRGFTVVSIHPGWVATDMGNLAGPGAMPATELVQKIMKIVKGLSTVDGAKFFNIDGTILP
ncbi:uncharacterized protein Z518_01679 [Rhinocladiella mackenziei CBS 650.93]|uniref:Rhinocladiella mackenziei CBS 650.93 unplaced genomic scaffold supercont1.1, whole genome shotgun sequence n=1 Tax=Rhinocladiella mackenziei CBS 650.93 TaxID=1442369 RepID=A0A0D2JMC3_9EURO|nr:uncharacterized protein Z518_01679 [Rhinocladiella mackenziei CBS 650.93]KIX10595.1 hypothetical protein Z518_01679 [Rhinocladiella mackenziei CBS 650.93]